MSRSTTYFSCFLRMPGVLPTISVSVVAVLTLSLLATCDCTQELKTAGWIIPNGVESSPDGEGGSPVNDVLFPYLSWEMPVLQIGQCTRLSFPHRPMPVVFAVVVDIAPKQSPPLISEHPLERVF